MSPRTTAWNVVTFSVVERSHVEMLISRDDLVERETRPRIFGAEVAHRLPARGIGENVDRRPRHSLNVANRAENTGLSVSHDFRHSPRVGSYHRYTGCERLESAQSKRLAGAWKEEHVGRRKQRGHVVDLAEEVNTILESDAASLLLGVSTIGAVSHHHQSRWDFLVDGSEDLHHVAHSLHPSEVGDVHEDGIGPQPLPEKRRICGSVVDGGIDEVVDHRHVA